MFHVWQLRIKLLKVNGDSILPYLLTWAMIYSFGINTDLGIDLNSIPYPVKKKDKNKNKKLRLQLPKKDGWMTSTLLYVYFYVCGICFIVDKQL